MTWNFHDIFLPTAGKIKQKTIIVIASQSQDEIIPARMTTSLQPQPEKLSTGRELTLTHILPALTTLLILVGISVYVNFFAIGLENQYVHKLARLFLDQSLAGTALQEAAFRYPDLLPVYGSSEMVPNKLTSHMFNLYEKYPTSFNVFDIAKPGNTALNMAQDLAALGSDIRGKKLVISFTPSMFTQPEAKETLYAGNFSRMHAIGLVFSTRLSLAIKRRAAERILAYPDTLNQDPVLLFALQNLTSNTFYNNLLYGLIFPLGQLDFAILRLQDHIAVAWYIYTHKSVTPMIERYPQSINWDKEITAAEVQQQIATSDNEFGIDNKAWNNSARLGFQFRPPGSYDKIYLDKLGKSKEWDDFQILLDIMQEMGAKPLILSRPINGRLYTASGISPLTQQIYYHKLSNLVNSYNFALVDFNEFTDDRYFNIDYTSHPSPKGWVLVFRTLDNFYHGRINN